MSESALHSIQPVDASCWLIAPWMKNPYVFAQANYNDKVKSFTVGRRTSDSLANVQKYQSVGSSTPCPHPSPSAWLNGASCRTV